MGFNSHRGFEPLTLRHLQCFLESDFQHELIVFFKIPRMLTELLEKQTLVQLVCFACKTYSFVQHKLLILN